MVTRVRVTPKVRWREEIFIKGEKAGYIQLVSYLTGDSPWWLEYKLYEPYRNQGIMSKELSKYLHFKTKWARQGGVNKMLAQVMRSNIASARLLEKNGFTKMITIEESDIYVIDLLLLPEMVGKMVKKVADNLIEHQLAQERCREVFERINRAPHP